MGVLLGLSIFSCKDVALQVLKSLLTLARIAKDENFFGHHQAREVRILGKFFLLILTFFNGTTVGQIMSLPYPTFERELQCLGYYEAINLCRYKMLCSLQILIATSNKKAKA